MTTMASPASDVYRDTYCIGHLAGFLRIKQQSILAEIFQIRLKGNASRRIRFSGQRHNLVPTFPMSFHYQTHCNGDFTRIRICQVNREMQFARFRNMITKCMSRRKVSFGLFIGTKSYRKGPRFNGAIS